ncbi:hypothetical protein [Lewinella sp. 4G2]|uniref:hypothetical protein n=1 Tax=Lewinella sp. 4G2 TaxID=1803372 RepID=UPI0007B4A47E|nr:hypothetical protein [Lewinella sp. 4G2]OAV45099.1 hypothetical protein A3850_011635 [Lewinella sp. 4G2]OAV45133.1 hypothetical protein A3850_011810 [Lewinella sp. 4G2]
MAKVIIQIAVLLILITSWSCERKLDLNGHYHVEKLLTQSDLDVQHIEIVNDSVVYLYYLNERVGQGKLSLKDSIIYLPSGHGIRKYGIENFTTLELSFEDSIAYTLQRVNNSIKHQKIDYYNSTGLDINLPYCSYIESDYPAKQLWLPTYIGPVTNVGDTQIKYSHGYRAKSLSNMHEIWLKVAQHRVKLPERLRDSVAVILHVDESISASLVDSVVKQYVKQDIGNFYMTCQDENAIDTFKTILIKHFVNVDEILQQEIERARKTESRRQFYQEEFIDRLGSVTFGHLSLSDNLNSEFSKFELQFYSELVNTDIYEYEVTNFLIKLYKYHLERAHQGYAINGNHEKFSKSLINRYLAMYDLEKKEFISSGIVEYLINNKLVTNYDRAEYADLEETKRSIILRR